MMIPTHNIPLPDWAKEIPCALTVCDADCTIIYMNERSQQINGKNGNPLGHNLMDYHNEHAREIINRLLSTGGTNVYTIEKLGVRKLIYQSAWKQDGKVAGLFELSIELPEVMPHYIRS